jgi:hypothetical protein
VLIRYNLLLGKYAFHSSRDDRNLRVNVEPYPTLALPRCTPFASRHAMSWENRMKIFIPPSMVSYSYYFLLFTLLYSTLTLIADRISTTYNTHWPHHTARRARRYINHTPTSKTPSTTHPYPTHNTSILLQTSPVTPSLNSLHPNGTTCSGVSDLGRSTRPYGKGLTGCV